MLSIGENIFLHGEAYIGPLGLKGSMYSLYHVRTNMNAEKGIILGTGVHNIHKGEVFFFSGVYILKRLLIDSFEVKVDVQKEP
jgi:hypothetical protein